MTTHKPPPNMASTVELSQRVNTKKEQGRKTVIRPVVPVIPNVVMSRKERRKSKQTGNATTNPQPAPDRITEVDLPANIMTSKDLAIPVEKAEKESTENVEPITAPQTKDVQEKVLPPTGHQVEPIPSESPTPVANPTEKPSTTTTSHRPVIDSSSALPSRDQIIEKTRGPYPITFGVDDASSTSSPQTPFAELAPLPQPPSYQSLPTPPTRIPFGNNSAAHRTSPARIFPIEYGPQTPQPQSRPIIFTPDSSNFGFNAQVPSFHPPEHQSTYSPTETPSGHSGHRSEQWSAPNRSATSNSSLDAEMKVDPPISPATDNSTGVLGENKPVEQNGLTDVAAKAEIVPTTDDAQGSPAAEAAEYAEDGLAPVGQYLLAMFVTADYTDWSIYVTSNLGMFPPTAIHIHAMFAGRSQFLDSQMTTHIHQPNYLCVIVMNSSHRFLQPSSLRLAISRLYGETLLTHETLAKTIIPQTVDGALISPLKARMEFALGYSVAGNLLQLAGVERRGLHLAAGLLDWRTLETALAFELTGDVRFWAKTGDDSLRRGTPQSGGSRRSSSIADTDRSTGYQDQDGRRVLEISCGPLGGSPFANEVSQAAFNFLVSNFPTDFQLDASIQLGEIPDRLPYVPNLKPTPPRLSSLRFGNLPSADELRFSAESRIVSRILLTIPFEMLFELFRGLAGKISKDVAISIVAERENRRLRVFNSQPGSDERLARDPEWYAVGWEEKINGKEDDVDFEFTRIPTNLQAYAVPSLS